MLHWSFTHRLYTCISHTAERMHNVNNGLSLVCTFTVDILEKEEIADRLSLLCTVSCVSLHVSTSSLKLTPTLIYSAPDLLLFCHPDMFNKYCLAGPGYTRGVVVCLHRRWWTICDAGFLINIFKVLISSLYEEPYIYTDRHSQENSIISEDIYTVFLLWLPF